MRSISIRGDEQRHKRRLLDNELINEFYDQVKLSISDIDINVTFYYCELSGKHLEKLFHIISDIAVINLSLENCTISDPTLDLLQNLIQYNTDIIGLHLSNNQLSECHAIRIMEALSNASSAGLCYLNLSKNNISFSKLLTDTLSQLLNYNIDISINLGNNNISNNMEVLQIKYLYEKAPRFIWL